MLYTVGTSSELPLVEKQLPHNVFQALVKNILILDRNYGANRNYKRSGGYCLIAEVSNDVEDMRKFVDHSIHPPEWVDLFGEYLFALFILNNDFGIVLVMPLAIAPVYLLDELE